MSHTSPHRLAVLLLAASVLTGCNRNVEPYVADEQPRTPDLARIFPEGAKAAPGGAPMLPPAPGGAPAPMARAVASPIRGTIRLDASLVERVPEDAVLFVVARREGGGGPPLAAKRIGAPRFPLDFTLGPEDRMMQNIPFEGPFELSVRLDADGNAASRNPGDMDGPAVGGIEPGARDVELVIDRVL